MRAQTNHKINTFGKLRVYDELLAMLAEKIEKRIEAEKKVDDLKKLIDSMEKKLASPEQNTKLGRSKSSKFCSKMNLKEERMSRETMAKWQ